MTTSDLGQRLRLAREGAGLSRERLAVAADLAVRSIQRYESGATSPSMATLERLAAALGVTIGSLIRDQP